MNHRHLGLPLGLICLALLAPAAQAGTDVVPNPVPGLASVRISDTDESGKVLIRAVTSAPITSGHFSSLFFDINNDGDSDLAIVVTKGSTGAAQLKVLSTPQSTTTCQQFGGTSASAITGATATLAGDNSTYTITVPAAQLPGTFRWKATATTPDTGDLCGSTDDAVQGLTLSVSDGRTFTGGGGGEPVDLTPPAAPTGLAAVAGNGTASLDWADNAESDLGGYLVYRRVQAGAFTLIAEVQASNLSDANLSNGTAYEYYVRAKDLTGNLSVESAKVTVTPQGSQPPTQSPTSPVTPITPVIPGVTPAKIPGAPRKPKVKSVSSKRVALDWPTLKGVTRYRVYRRLAGHAWPKKPLATVTSSSYVDKKVKPGKTYQYRIVGVTSANKLTKPSKTITVKTKKATKKKSRR
jgi:hypothetical protein